MEHDPPQESHGPQQESHTTPPMATPVSELPAPMPSRKKPRGFARLLLAMLMLMLFGSLALNVLLVGGILASSVADSKVQEKFVSHQRNSRNKVAIISVEGAILSGEGFVKHQIDRAMADSQVKAVVLRVNSPGGSITGSDYIYHHLCKLAEKKKGRDGIPIVVSMGGMAASGGYYVSMAVGDTPDSIFAEPTTWTGSIGVVIPHYNVAGLMEKWGIEEDSVASGPLKRMGSLSKPIEGEQLEVFEQLIDDGFTRFKEVIKSGRPRFSDDPDALDELATGQVYTANQAKENGLSDKIGFIEDAVRRAIKLAKLSEKDVKVVRYKREFKLTSMFLGAQSPQRSPELAALLEMTVPRAYYLCTWLPPLTE